MSANQDRPIFEAVDPRWTTYRLYADGRIEGLEVGARIDNAVPLLSYQNQALKRLLGGVQQTCQNAR